MLEYYKLFSFVDLPQVFGLVDTQNIDIHAPQSYHNHGIRIAINMETIIVVWATAKAIHAKLPQSTKDRTFTKQHQTMITLGTNHQYLIGTFGGELVYLMVI